MGEKRNVKLYFVELLFLARGDPMSSMSGISSHIGLHETAESAFCSSDLQSGRGDAGFPCWVVRLYKLPTPSAARLECRARD